LEIGPGRVAEANKLPLCSILATVRSILPEVLESEIYGNAITAWGLAAILTAAILVAALVTGSFWDAVCRRPGRASSPQTPT
jgi:hypothetical protein